MTKIYKDVLKDYITGSHPTREDAQGRIDFGVAAGKLSPEDAAELTGLLEDSTVLVGVLDAIRALSGRMDGYLTRLEALEAEAGTATPLPEGVKEWFPPSGSHDAPNMGDLRLYGGVVYRSKMDGNPTVPGSDTRYWEVVE